MQKTVNDAPESPATEVIPKACRRFSVSYKLRLLREAMYRQQCGGRTAA